jgi:hypothetical protein
MERTDRGYINPTPCTSISHRSSIVVKFCQSISQASQVADRVGEQLQAHWEGTAASYEIQLAAAKNAEQLASVLGSLTSTTQEELRQINNVTHNIRENLSKPQGHGARIWYSILLHAFRVVGGGMFYRTPFP